MVGTDTARTAPLILIVGVCASGKTTLSGGLRALGYNARSLAQEHSVSPRFWRRRQPDFLILLHCELSTIKARKGVTWGMSSYEQQKDVLRDAREHADLVLTTDGLTPEQLISYVHQTLQEHGIYPSQGGEGHDCQL
ncbi:MAG: hypothetical protein ACOX48_07615 [Limnochordia bacterium]